MREGLQIAVRTGGWFELNHYLDGCGYLCAETGRPAEALTMWTASAALLGPADLRLRDLPLRAARRALGADRTRAAEERGAAMSLAAAAEYALMLTAPGAQQVPPGPAKLSSRERELVTLVARGRTNAQIAAELFISVRTVGSHLDRIRDKTGCRRRADLTRLAPRHRPDLTRPPEPRRLRTIRPGRHRGAIMSNSPRVRELSMTAC